MKKKTGGLPSQSNKFCWAFKISSMIPTSRIQPKPKLTQSTGKKYSFIISQCLFGIDDLSYAISFYISQNRLEYEKRVRAQAKAMTATNDLLS